MSAVKEGILKPAVWPAVLLSIAFGIAAEVAAYTLGLWTYRSVLYPAINVLLVFGVIMGLLAAFTRNMGIQLTFAAAASIGFLYELANFDFLDWWHFPGGQFLIFHGKLTICLVLALLWGSVPLLVSALRRVLR